MKDQFIPARVEAQINTTELFAMMALPLILLHNGQRGTKMNKWVFYPGHLLALYLVGLWLRG